MTAIAKFWVCKRTISATAEALECLGGNGFVEDSPMPRLYRDSPLNSIWEGSGNVIALDVLRTLQKAPEALDALLAEVEQARGADARLDGRLARARDEVASLLAGSGDEAQYLARRVVTDLALLLQASLVLRHSPSAVADAFVATRLSADGERPFGTLPSGTDARAIVERHRPKLASG